MSALALTHRDDDAVPEESNEISLDAETYAFLRRTMRNMQRSLRCARPTPREGIEAGLTLMLCAVEERLDARTDDE